MNKCYISITFDDGREDNYRNAYKILKKHNLKATIYVISGYIDGTYTNKLASSYGPMSLSNLEEIKKSGFEISLHGDKHITSYDDLIKCEEKLKSWKLINENYGFSMPHSKEEQLSNKKLMKKIKHDLQYVRVGKDKKCLKFLNKFFYLIYMITKNNCFYYLYNRNNIIDLNNVDWFHLVSVPVKKGDKAKSLLSLIKTAQKKDSLIIFMFHSILKKNDPTYNESKWEYDYEEFDKFCDSLEEIAKNGKIKVMPLIEIKKEISNNV